MKSRVHTINSASSPLRSDWHFGIGDGPMNDGRRNLRVGSIDDLSLQSPSELQQFVAQFLRSGFGTFELAQRKALDNATNDLRLIKGIRALQNADEPFPRRAVHFVRIDVEIAIVGIEVGVRSAAEVAEIAAGDSDVAIDDPHDFEIGQPRHGLQLCGGTAPRHLRLIRHRVQAFAAGFRFTTFAVLSLSCSPVAALRVT